jgi:hypothetical protein
MDEKTQSLDLVAQDVSDTAWEDLVQVMMQDELDAMALAYSRPQCTCACTCGPSGCSC